MFIAALFRKRIFNTTDESVIRFIVMPWDCVFKLVGNDRYHAFMDIGRIDLIMGFGWGRIMWKKKWNPFVRNVDILYRYPLQRFQRFKLRTRMIYWDEQYFWMEHIFERKGQIFASAISKNSANSRKGVVRTREALRLLNRDLQRPTCPEKIQAINDAEELLKKIQSSSLQNNGKRKHNGEK
jgi:acyl-CoA thioesterase FadM